MFKRQKKINSTVHLPIIEISSEVDTPNPLTLFSANVDAAFEDNVNKYGNRTFKGPCPIQCPSTKKLFFHCPP